MGDRLTPLNAEKGNARMAGRDSVGEGKEAPTVQGGSKGVRAARTRTIGGVGVCLVSVSSILVLTGPASAAHEVGAAYQTENGHFSVQLSGRDVPGGGDPDGQGSSTLDLDPREEKACFTISWSRLDGEVTAFHLHAAARGSEGPHWIDFFNDQRFPGAQNNTSNCVPAPRDKINAVINRPADYYLNVHSTAFVKGAIRGQLNQ
jgi:CHRD domain